jgi:hypothetical protein
MKVTPKQTNVNICVTRRCVTRGICKQKHSNPLNSLVALVKEHNTLPGPGSAAHGRLVLGAHV